jgi:hypothetical protein
MSETFDDNNIAVMHKLAYRFVHRREFGLRRQLVR